jgi:hypothetical protein
VFEPGGVATELGSHNKLRVRNAMIDPFYEQTEVLSPDDIADAVAYMVTRPGTPSSGAVDDAHRPGLTASGRQPPAGSGAPLASHQHVSLPVS